MRPNAIVLAAAAGLSGCTKTVTESAPDVTPPLVVWTNPSADASAVPLGARVDVIFSEPMDPSSINASSFTVTGPQAADVPGSVTLSPDQRTASFVPSSLEAGASYAVTISTDAHDVAGNALEAAASWSFSTVPAAGSLAVVSTSPPNGSTNNHAATTQVAITFSNELDCTADVSSSLQVFDNDVQVPGYTTCSGSALAFTPLYSLPTRTSLRAQLLPGVIDLQGNRLDTGLSWGFDVAPWTQLVGSSGVDTIAGIAADPSGGIYVTGYTDAALVGSNQGGLDVFVRKYDTTGAVLWTRQLGTSADEYSSGIAVGPDGDIYVTGWTYGTIGPQPSSGSGDVFLSKFDEGGTLLWTTQFGTSGDDQPWGGIAIDANNDIVVAGITSGAFPGFSASSGDAFVVKLDNTGTVQWVQQYGGSEFCEADAVAAGNDGTYYVAGGTNGALPGNSSAGQSDAYLARIDGNGAFIWIRQWGTIDGDGAEGLAVEPTGNVVVSGVTLANAANPGDADTFVTKFTSAGDLDWTYQRGTSQEDIAVSTAVDSSGEIYVVGWTEGVLFGNATQSVGEALFVEKLSASGLFMWGDQIDDTGGLPSGITLSNDDKAYVFGESAAGLDGAPGYGGWDGLVVRYSADGRQE